MSETTFTHKALAELLGVSETTVKSYRRKFPGCIPVASQGKPIRFTAEAAAVATRIRDLFETGMSIDEVRARLAGEFSWISRETPKSEAKAPAERAELAPEISMGVSNMAKSLVAMTQQQKTLLTRLQVIEGLLEEAGLTGGGQLPRARSAPAKTEDETHIKNRLDSLDATTQELAESVTFLTEQLSRFLGQRDKAAETWKQEAAATLSAAAQLVEDVREAGKDEEQAAGTSAKIVPLRPGGDAQAPPPVESRPANVTVPSEPPRHFFSLPLVVRNEQGQFLSAGGRGRGRFSTNDLKAMLIYGYTPPNHFSLRWESHGQGWWLHLEQNTTERSFHLLLMELSSQKSGPMAEVLQVKRNNDIVPPVEICAIIDSFSA